MLPFGRPWSGLYQRRPEINWSSGHTQGLVCAVLPGHRCNLVTGEPFPRVDLQSGVTLNEPEKLSVEGLYAWGANRSANEFFLWNNRAENIRLYTGNQITLVAVRYMLPSTVANRWMLAYNLGAGGVNIFEESWTGGQRSGHRYANHNGTTVVDSDNFFGFALVDTDVASGQGWMVSAVTQDLRPGAGIAASAWIDAAGAFVRSEEAVTAGATQLGPANPVTTDGLALLSSATTSYVGGVFVFDRAMSELELEQYLRGIFAYTFRQDRARRYFVPAAGGGVTLTPAGVVQAQALDSPALGQTHALVAGDLVQAQAFDQPGITQDHQLAPGELAQAQALDSPSVTAEHQLAPADVSQDQALESPGVTQDHQLSPDDLVQPQALDAPGLTQDAQLAPTDIAQQQAVEAPTLEQVHALAVMDMAQVQSLEAASLIIAGVLSPQDIAQIQQLGAVVIQQDHQLTVADLTQLQALDAPTATQTVTVTPQGIAQAQDLEPVTLIVTGVLQPLSIAQQQALDAGQITQTNLLTPADIAQLQVLGAPSSAAAGYLVVSSIRILPALDADVTVLPALTGTVSIKPH